MFHLNNCGYERFAEDNFRIYRPCGSGDYLFLLWQTPMTCRFPDETVTTKENACILYTPGFCQDYQSVHKFRNSFIHFSSDLFLEEKYSIPTNRILYPNNFHLLEQLINDIQREQIMKMPYCEDRILHLMQELFLQLSRALQQTKFCRPEDSCAWETMQNLRLQMLRNCEQDWPIERLCYESHFEKSQFYYYYKLFFRSSPKAELLDARMARAASLLTNESLQVQQVAQLCGFCSLQHFSRYFRAQYHCSPREFTARRIKQP